MPVRIEPRLRYGAELAARKQRRTLSSFMEEAIEEALERTSLDPITSFRDALEMAGETVGRSPSITYLHVPPLAIADVR